jgi:hypothetical protein
MDIRDTDARGTGRPSGEGRFDTLCELLDAVEKEAEASGSMSFGQVQDMAGRRSYGPLLLLPGLVAVSPLSGVPTVPSIIGLIVAIVSAQLLAGRMRVWLPARLRDASLDRGKVSRGLRFARPVARVVDRIVHRRLPALTGSLSLRIAAAACLLVGATMPPLEILPFLATSAGLVITLYGLALTVHDGVLVVAAHALVLGLVIWGVSAVGG